MTSFLQYYKKNKNIVRYKLLIMKAGLLGSLAIMGSVQADTTVEDDAALEVPVSAWHNSSGELGFTAAHGNSTTESLNGRLKLRYLKNDWLHSLDLFGLRSRATYESIDNTGLHFRERKTTAQRFSITTGSARQFGEYQQLSATVRYEHDQFAAFDRRQIFGLGYGSRLINGQYVVLESQLGPGWRRARETETGHYLSDFIGRALLELKIKLTENAELNNSLLLESGPDNSFVQNDLGLTVAMNEHLALKTSYQLRSNSQTDKDRRRIDSLLMLNMVYRFQ